MNPRVAMIISQFHPLWGGTEKQALRLALALQKKGVSVCVLTRCVKGCDPFEIVGGVPVCRAIRAVEGQRFYRLSYFFSTLWFLLRNRKRYDIIHCHILHGMHTPAALIIKALLKKKVIIKVAATGALSDFGMLKKTPLGALFSSKLKRADTVIALCAQAAQEAERAGIPPEKIVTIYNGVDIDSVPEQAHKDPLTVVFVGRLTRSKGIHILLEAFARLSREHAEAHLLIVGEGPQKKALESQARDLGVGAQVTFTGEAVDVFSFLQRASVFVLPSFSEGLSNAVLEAMACSLPVVATDCGGTPEIITHGSNGILVGPGSADQIYSAIKKIIADRDFARSLGKNARDTVAGTFSINAAADRYCDLYRSLLNSDAP